MVEQIDKRILKENINLRELKPYFQKVQKTKKTNISCKLQNQEKELLEEFFKSNGKTNQEGYEEILLDYIDSLCFEQKYFQFEYCFSIEFSKKDFDDFASSTKIHPLGFRDNYKSIEKNINLLLGSNYGTLRLKESEIIEYKFVKEIRTLDLFEIAEDMIHKQFPYVFIIQLNNLLDVKAKDGTYRKKYVINGKNDSNKHSGLEVIMVHDYFFFFFEYEWEFIETKEGYKVFIDRFRIIPFEKIRADTIYQHKNKKIQEYIDNSLQSLNAFGYMNEEAIKSNIEKLENEIEFLNGQINYCNIEIDYYKEILEIKEREESMN